MYLLFYIWNNNEDIIDFWSPLLRAHIFSTLEVHSSYYSLISLKNLKTNNKKYYRNSHYIQYDSIFSMYCYGSNADMSVNSRHHWANNIRTNIDSITRQIANITSELFPIREIMNKDMYRIVWMTRTGTSISVMNSRNSLYA